MALQAQPKQQPQQAQPKQPTSKAAQALTCSLIMNTTSICCVKAKPAAAAPAPVECATPAHMNIGLSFGDIRSRGITANRDLQGSSPIYKHAASERTRH
eukprot:2536081-Amphidinium_carterae.2